MASTLLAVDDSVTIRKVLDITFAGTEHTLVTVDSADAAMQRLKSDHPDLVIADATLEPKSGYDLCSAIKQAAPGTRVLILSSKLHPYDAAKGSAAGADDHIDKPYDTQQMIDKVQKLLEGKAEAPAAAAPAPAIRSTVTQPSVSAVSAPLPSAPPRAKTLMFGQGGASGMAPFVGGGPKPTPAPAPAAAPKAAPAPAAAHTAPAGVSAPPVAASASAPPTAKASAVASAVNGQLAGKLEGLGLTPAQVEAVTALSRDIVERVVWEVVPVLAETMIKEEIARLTK